jgi:hypothetical protein
MGRPTGAAIVWIASCLPIALRAFDPSESVLALAALPWLAWAGIPWRAKEDPIATSALALPPLAAALALDVSRGAPARVAITAGIASVAMIVLLAFGAVRSSTTRGSFRAFDLAWLVLVPGLPVLRCALELGGAPAYGPAPRWLTIAASTSPLAWSLRSAAAPWPAIAVCAGLLLISGVGRGEERA